MEWLERFFSERGTLGAIVTSASIGMIAGVGQGLVQKKHGGWSGFLSAIAVGILVSVIVGLGIKDYVHSEAFRLAIVGGAAVISDDILAGLRALGRLIREDPLGSLSRLIDALRGKSVAPAPTAAPPPGNADDAPPPAFRR